MSPQTKPRVNVLLDSGAWSAWTRGVELSLLDYIEFVKQNRRYLWNYINMDVIPGTASRRRDRSDVEKAAKASYGNQQKMKAAGLSPWPVFHQGEDFVWLDRYLRDGEKYVAVSTAKNQSDKEQELWLVKTMARLTNPDGNSIVKIHGLGNSAIGLLRRFPFASVDSSGWMTVSGWGILVPPYYKGKPDYRKRPLTVSLVGESSYVSLGPLQQNIVTRFLTEEVGCTLEDVIGSYQYRRLAVIKFLLRAAREARPELKYIFASTVRRSAYGVLRDGGSSYDLLSYFDVMKQLEWVKNWALGNVRRFGYRQQREVPKKKRQLELAKPSFWREGPHAS